MPEEMPADFDFLVRYGYGEVTKNEINTYQDSVVKDLIMNGTATADITLTEDEMRSIYERMRGIHIMGKLELVPSSRAARGYLTRKTAGGSPSTASHGIGPGPARIVS